MLLTILFVWWVAVAGSSSSGGSGGSSSSSGGSKGESEEYEKELCKEKEAGEWFRLVAGEGDSCRDVIQCTSSGLQAIRYRIVLFLVLLFYPHHHRTILFSTKQHCEAVVRSQYDSFVMQKRERTKYLSPESNESARPKPEQQQQQQQHRGFATTSVAVY